MGVRIGLIYLLVLSTSWASDARELVITDHSSGETVISDASVLQVVQPKSRWEVQASKEVDRNEEVCILCEEFAAEAIKYLAENKTQTEVIDILHKTCSRLLSFKRECITLVNYYAPLLFLEISSIQPEYFCKKVNLCDQMVFTSRALSKGSCELCNYAVAEVLLKLKDPHTECKRLVFEYGPLILVTAEQFLETTDLCTTIHACDLPTASNNKEASSSSSSSSMEIKVKPMFSDS